MRIRSSRNSILVAATILVLMAFVPNEIRKFIQSGPYLFTHQFLVDLFARFSGPGRLRFIVQPLAAIAIGVRDGKGDVRKGRMPFLWAIVCRHASKRILLREALTSLGSLVAVAILLDVISQFLIFRQVHPGAALVLGPILIAVPYSLSRALTNRIFRTRSAQPVVHSS